MALRERIPTPWAAFLLQEAVVVVEVPCSNLAPWGEALVSVLISMIRITIPRMTKGHLLLVPANPAVHLADPVVDLVLEALTIVLM